ncbi:hypothetical protein BDV3_007116 [Batrachochytrium dendrobatidis]
MLVWVVNRTEDNDIIAQSYEECMQLLDPQEQSRIKGYRFQKDAFSSLVGQVLPRAAICRHIPDISLQQLQFHRTSIGRPFMTISNCCSFNPTSPSMALPDYNISHHGEYIALIMAPFSGSTVSNLSSGNSQDQWRVGVDLTKIDQREIDDPETFFGYFDEQFSKLEWEWIRHGVTGEANVLVGMAVVSPDSIVSSSIITFQPKNDHNQDMIRRFHCMWALKEAYVKGVGCGIVTNLQDIVFLVSSYNSNNPSTIKLWQKQLSVTLMIHGKISHDWLFQVQLVDEQHIICMASTSKYKGDLSFDIVKWSNVLDNCGIRILNHDP